MSVFLNSGFDLIWRAASIPSISGIITSMMIKWGWKDLAAAMASFPFVAFAKRKFSFSKLYSNNSKMSASSSTSRILYAGEACAIGCERITTQI